MGVYISQVRSLTLDSIKATSIQRIKTIGNTKANAVYEALLPENFDRLQVKKGHRRKEFIIEKYVHMQYVTETDKERILKESKCSVAMNTVELRSTLGPGLLSLVVQWNL